MPWLSSIGPLPESEGMFVLEDTAAKHDARAREVALSATIIVVRGGVNK
jgi:hypothetical protein